MIHPSIPNARPSPRGGREQTPSSYQTLPTHVVGAPGATGAGFPGLQGLEATVLVQG